MRAFWSCLQRKLLARRNFDFFEYPGIEWRVDAAETDTQDESVLLGFWVFMMSDAILFAMAFATYATMVPMGYAGGPQPRELFQLGPIFAETLLLLASSFTMGLASIALKYCQPVRRLVGWLVLTLVLGAAFLALEWRDFSAMFAAGALPTRSGYLSSFFGLVPLHGLHVLAGCIWLACMLVQISMYGVDRRCALALMRLALFWHFLGIVWIFIYSVVYLGGLA
ncbi:cytochrome c oxidase subunit 3 [Comamonas sp. NLF-1-9]|uniref:cytochrome c oxidase subunit 3 n=1 Tax=Comamonas sp. NLF-1-9 TaxID=2853163 RepID=UPI001C445DE4|nr:cytochrome c oxidase subunit 3 [Comamonas sp. NLF-1-9]QXL85929.1 cytochrome c oxidase subunit 3 [Comamonas sp. NLF-1-9]